ncbi:MAG: Maf family protein, partial [Flavobacterium sp.]|nr:Maf family protein [Flavobacterium sp.]
SDFDLDFEIRVKEIEEVYPVHLKATEITNYLALLKANAFDGELLNNELLVTSDTIVWQNNCAIGKPKNFENAVEMLQNLSNKKHKVITSVCFKTNSKTEVFSEITEVTFTELSLNDIHYYLNTYKPYDKAGAYGIQDWIGLIGISKIEGSYTNVVGLPTHLVYNFLRNLK